MVPPRHRGRRCKFGIVSLIFWPVTIIDIETPLDDDKLSYFLSRIEVVRGNTPGMSRWRKRLFVATS